MPRPVSHASGQAGSALIEVLVSAVVLLLAAGATLSLIDNAGAVQNASRARVAAGALAEQDQERMRAMSVTAFGETYDTTRDVTVGNPPLTYTVRSTATWVKDTTEADDNCSASAGLGDYLNVTSTVTPKGAKVAPVKVVSLITPRVGALGDTGTLVVPVKDRNGDPNSGIVVTLTGPQSATAVTNDAGCAVFSTFPSGTYTARIGTSGYVNRQSITDLTLSGLRISAGQVTTAGEQIYDRASAITATFDTQDPTTPTPPPTAARAMSLTVANSGVGNDDGGFRLNASAAAPGDQSITASNLFPFADGWAVYAGSCAANDPSGYTGTGAVANTVSVTPGRSATATVRVPTLRFTNLPGTPTKVVLTSADSGCAQKFTYTGRSVVTVAAPYGRYSICLTDGTYQTSPNTTPTLNGRPGGTTIDMRSTSIAQGTCS